MKKLVSIIVLTALLVSCVGIVSAATEDEATVDLVKDGVAQYSITYSYMWVQSVGENKEPVEELQKVIAEITGAEPTVYEAENEINDKEIFIGETTRTLARHKERVEAGGDYSIDKALLGESGFLIRTAGERIIIIGGSTEATWAAISYFVANYLKYDVNNPAAEKQATLSVPQNINYVYSAYLDCDLSVEMKLGDTPIDSFKIVCGANASDTELESAELLRRNLYAMTGRAPELVRDSAEATANEIVIGDTTRYDTSALADDEYLVKSEGGKLILAGGTANGTDYAVAHLLSEYMMIKNAAYTGTSALNLAADINDTGKMPFHSTVIEGVAYSDYIRDNIGALLGNDETPCYSDASTADALYDALKAKNPAKGDTVYLISNTAKYCDCENCKGETAAFFETVNKVAEKFAADEVTVATLAYKETRKPTVEKMADNVRVIVAEPSLCCGHAVNDSSCDTNRAFAEDLVAWTKASDDVTVLDFTMNYYDYPSTFPNFDVIYPNISYYKEIGVESVLMAWEKNSAALEFGELRYALLEAVLANPTMTADEYSATREEILKTLYGDISGKISEYIEKFTAASADHFTIFSEPAEILPIKAVEGKSGAEGYDLTLAKELGQIWESVYKRHDPPTETLTGLKMRLFNRAYIESDYYLPLHSRVQYTSWIDANIPVADRTNVFNAIIESFS